MKALLSSALVLWFFGVLFFLNRAKAANCSVIPGVTSPALASAGLPIISFDHYSHKPDTSAAFHLLRDSLLGVLQPTDRLKIIANYTIVEADSDKNIGLKRANSIRSLFEGYEGFDRIEIESKIGAIVSIPTRFEVLSDNLTQNALDTPIPPMMEEKEEIAEGVKKSEAPIKKEVAAEELAEESSKEQPVRETPIVEKNDADYVIYFNDSSSKMLNAAKVQRYLDELSVRVKRSKEKLIISGFDDNSRSGAESLELAHRRTYRVRKAFTDKYVRRKLVEIKNIGQTNPVAPNNTTEGRSKNRRVEIRIVKN